MFKLNIECSTDFDELHIKFKDGSTFSTDKEETTENSENTPLYNNNTREKRSKRKKLPDYLDTSEIEETDVSDAVIKPPVIEDKERPANVADELQNLDI